MFARTSAGRWGCSVTGSSANGFRTLGDFPGGKEGDVLTVECTVAGVSCLGLNGGLAFKHNEAFFFQIATEDPEETDRYWNAIVGNGGQEARAAGASTSGASPGRSRHVC